MTDSPPASVLIEPALFEWKRTLHTRRLHVTMVAAVLALLSALTAWRCQVDLPTLMAGLHKGLSIIGMFFPLQARDVPDMLKPMAETIVLAMIATVAGMCLSLPCALAASSNLSPAPLRLVMRSFIAIERALPEIVQLLLFIVIFGLGVIPGLIALSISSIGMLAKLLADSIEEIEPAMLESVAGTGATSVQVIRYAVFPQIFPAILANGLFRFEFNVRAAVILGAVGGGGIGYEMSAGMRSMDFPRAGMATLLTLVLVFAAERVSDLLRARVLAGGTVR
jgi:phosphonate transport system permease protein